jgi:putative FmdB family regulatory protein
VPIYEYECADCGRKTEVIQRVGERPIRLCPHCGGKLKKKVSAPAIQFKGSGWYVTDYARAKKEGKEGKKSGEKSESTEKAAEKPAEKKEGKEKKSSKE